MKLVESGEGKIPLLSVIAILAISLTVNLPGLAISPVLGELHKIMKTTPLEVQLLNVLPNLVTIPFILCAGKICTPRNQLTVLTTGLIIFTATGIGYFFAKSMIVLIILSCILGVGCGLVIPLAASLISQNFSGKPRGTVLGTKSGLSNFSIIIATLFVGWVAAKNWHLSFIVYFVPLIPLALVPFMRSDYINKFRKAPVLEPKSKAEDTGFHFEGKKAVKMMWGAMLIYFAATYATIVISYYLPFTMDSYGLSTSQVGVATAMYYLSATISGFGLARAIRLTGVWTLQIGLILATLGLFAIGFIHTYACYIIGVFIMGLGYGLVQPILYDKTSYFAPNDAKSTEYFAFLLTCNYVGISSVPFIVEFFKSFIKGSDNPSFPYILNGIILGIVAIICIVIHKSFVVQAGVIPEGDDIVKQPSSVIAPGDRLVDDAPQDDDSAVAPLKLAAETEAATDKITTDATAPAQPAPADVEEDKATEAIVKAAEASLKEAGESMTAMRQEHAEMLRKESQLLSDKAEELRKEAQELLDEANELEDN